MVWQALAWKSCFNPPKQDPGQVAVSAHDFVPERGYGMRLHQAQQARVHYSSRDIHTHIRKGFGVGGLGEQLYCLIAWIISLPIKG